MAAKFVIYPTPAPVQPEGVRYKLLDKNGDCLFQSEYFDNEREARSHIVRLKNAASKFTKVEVRDHE